MIALAYKVVTPTLAWIRLTFYIKVKVMFFKFFFSVMHMRCVLGFPFFPLADERSSQSGWFEDGTFKSFWHLAAFVLMVSKAPSAFCIYIHTTTLYLVLFESIVWCSLCPNSSLCVVLFLSTCSLASSASYAIFYLVFSTFYAHVILLISSVLYAIFFHVFSAFSVYMLLVPTFCIFI